MAGLEIISPTIRRLRAQVLAKRPNAVRSFWERMEHNGTPIVERVGRSPHERLLTFVWRGERGTRTVGLRSMLAGDAPTETLLSRLPGTNVWFRTYAVHDDLRDPYTFAIDEPLRAPVDLRERTLWRDRNVRDPFNPQTLPHARDRCYPKDVYLDNPVTESLVELPGAPRHSEGVSRPGVAPGRVEEHIIRSAHLKEDRRVWVHIPAGVSPRQSDLRVAVFFDGFVYLRMMPGATILDNLVAAHRIPPTISVFIDSKWFLKERLRDLCKFHPPFGKFLVRELLPWVRRNYGVHLRPERTMLVGLSCGGVAALHWAATYPTHFRLVLSQSGSMFMWVPPEKEPGMVIHKLIASPRLPLRVWMDVGKLEGNYAVPWGMTVLGGNRHLRDVLRLKEYDLTYREYNASHHPQCWKESLIDGMVELLGTPPRGEPRRRGNPGR